MDEIDYELAAEGIGEQSGEREASKVWMRVQRYKGEDKKRIGDLKQVKEERAKETEQKETKGRVKMGDVVFKSLR